MIAAAYHGLEINAGPQSAFIEERAYAFTPNPTAPVTRRGGDEMRLQGNPRLRQPLYIAFVLRLSRDFGPRPAQESQASETVYVDQV